jgi:hypothetical protein
MADSVAELFHDWHDFYVLVGTASATLVGLMFVALSIGSSIFNEKKRAGMRAFITPTVLHFAAVLFACLIIVMPTHSWQTLGSVLGLGALLGLFESSRIERSRHPSPLPGGFERPSILRPHPTAGISDHLDLRGTAIDAVTS